MIQDFIDNPTIRYLAAKPYWTVNVEKKKPLDIKEFERTGLIIGAKNEKCLTTLSDLLRIIDVIPKQFVYSLNAARDNVVVLDIEKTCPDDIKTELLKLPFLYGDISMSGLGCHLVLPCPPLDEITQQKVVLKEDHGYYEILIHHYVTFTNNTLFARYDESTSPISFQKIWDELKASKKNAVKQEIEFDESQISLDFPQYNSLKDIITRNFLARFRKTPEDFNNDMSRYEFAVIGSVRYSTELMLSVPMYARLNLDDSQKIMLVYKIVQELLEPREKHNEKRDGKPMLLYQVYNSFTTTYENNSSAD